MQMRIAGTQQQTRVSRRHVHAWRGSVCNTTCVCAVLQDEWRGRSLSSSQYELVGADSQKANIIASQAARDSDDYVAASRRHDRDFLHDVANKLVRCVGHKVVHVLG